MPDSGTTTDSADTGDSGTTGGMSGSALTVTDTFKPSVFRVSFTTDTVAEGTIEYGVDGTFDHTLQATSADGLTHTALMAGLGSGATWSLRPSARAEGGTWTGAAVTVDVPLPEESMADFVLADGSDVDADGLFLVACAGSGSDIGGSVSIIDHAGRRTWWQTGGVKALISEAWLVDETVWWMSFGEESYLRRQDLDGENDATFPLPNLSHSFVIMPDGSVIVDMYQDREVDGVTVRGDDLVHFDRDGTLIATIWSTWDHFTFDPSTLTDEDPYPWSHVNTVRYDAATNTLVVTALNFDAFIGVDPDTGETKWIVGGPYSDFDMSGVEDEDQPLGMHGAVLTERGLLYFNNRVERIEEGEYWSEAVEYDIDWDAKTVQTAWTYEADRSVFSVAMGNAEDRADGRRMVSFGVAGRIVELTDDVVTWQADTPIGTANGFIHPLESVAGATR